MAVTREQIFQAIADARADGVVTKEEAAYVQGLYDTYEKEQNKPPDPPSASEQAAYQIGGALLGGAATAGGALLVDKLWPKDPKPVKPVVDAVNGGAEAVVDGTTGAPTNTSNGTVPNTGNSAAIDAANETGVEAAQEALNNGATPAEAAEIGNQATADALAVGAPDAISAGADALFPSAEAVLADQGGDLVLDVGGDVATNALADSGQVAANEVGAETATSAASSFFGPSTGTLGLNSLQVLGPAASVAQYYGPSYAHYGEKILDGQLTEDDQLKSALLTNPITAWAVPITDALGIGIKSGKDKDQKMRDALRSRMTEVDFLDDDYGLQLADGSTVNLGSEELSGAFEGGQVSDDLVPEGAIYNVDWEAIQNDPEAEARLNRFIALGYALGGRGSRGTDMGAAMFNAAQYGGGDPAENEAAIFAQAEESGFDYSAQRNNIFQAWKTEGIDAHHRDAALAALDARYGEAQGENRYSVDDEFWGSIADNEELQARNQEEIGGLTAEENRDLLFAEQTDMMAANPFWNQTPEATNPEIPQVNEAPVEFGAELGDRVYPGSGDSSPTDVLADRLGDRNYPEVPVVPEVSRNSFPVDNAGEKSEASFAGSAYDQMVGGWSSTDSSNGALVQALAEGGAAPSSQAGFNIANYTPYFGQMENPNNPAPNGPIKIKVR